MKAPADALLFDLGGVVMGLDWDRAFLRWAAASGVAAGELRRRYAFSNSNAAHQAVWSRRFEAALANFRRVFVSSEMGLRKPERASFERVSREIGVPAGRILFFDDTLANVEGARRAGLQAVQVRGPDDVLHAVRPWL